MTVAENKRLLLGDASSARREAYNELRVTLAARFRDAGLSSPILGVTSAGGEDGHRYLAANIATAYARLEKKVLLIDADFRGEGLSSILNAPLDIPGLADCVEGAPLAVIGLGEEGLSFLPRGGAPENAADLLGSPAFTKFFADLRAQYDLIVVNLPSAHSFADAATAAAALDGVTLGIAVAADLHRDLHHALYLLETAALPIFGLVAIEK